MRLKKILFLIPILIIFLFPCFGEMTVNEVIKIKENNPEIYKYKINWSKGKAVIIDKSVETGVIVDKPLSEKIITGQWKAVMLDSFNGHDDHYHLGFLTMKEVNKNIERNYQTITPPFEPKIKSYYHDLKYTFHENNKLEIIFERYFNGKPGKFTEIKRWKYSNDNKESIFTDWSLSKDGINITQFFEDKISIKTKKKNEKEYICTKKIEWRSLNGKTYLYISGLGLLEKVEV